MIWYAAYAQDHAGRSITDGVSGKSHMQEVSKFVAAQPQVHGGMGFTDLLGLHYWFKRIGANRQLLGGPETAAEAAELQGWVG